MVRTHTHPVYTGKVRTLNGFQEQQQQKYSKKKLIVFYELCMMSETKKKQCEPLTS